MGTVKKFDESRKPRRRTPTKKGSMTPARDVDIIRHVKSVKEATLFTLSHELNNRLVSINTISQILREKFEIERRHDILGYSDRIAEENERLNRMIKEERSRDIEINDEDRLLVKRRDGGDVLRNREMSRLIDRFHEQYRLIFDAADRMHKMITDAKPTARDDEIEGYMKIVRSDIDRGRKMLARVRRTDKFREVDDGRGNKILLIPRY